MLSRGKYKRTGNMGGVFKRSDMLMPSDPFFADMAAIYYRQIKKLYGIDIHFLGGDPFHEGDTSDSLQQAWQILLKNAYKTVFLKDKGAPANVFCVRPAWNLDVVSTGSIKRAYDEKLFVKGVKFLSIASVMRNRTTYNVDAIDFLRQILADRGVRLYGRLNSAFYCKDTTLFKQMSRQFLNTILTEDSLLSLNGHFCLNTWMSVALRLGKPSYEKKVIEWNGRTQIAYWGPDDPKLDYMIMPIENGVD